MDEDFACPYCGDNICIFLQFEADVLGLRRWNTAVMALRTNQERRKKIFQTYHRWRLDGGGSRIKHKRCVKIGVRTWFLDRTYMGFHDADDVTSRNKLWICSETASTRGRSIRRATGCWRKSKLKHLSCYSIIFILRLSKNFLFLISYFLFLISYF